MCDTNLWLLVRAWDPTDDGCEFTDHPAYSLTPGSRMGPDADADLGRPHWRLMVRKLHVTMGNDGLDQLNRLNPDIPIVPRWPQNIRHWVQPRGEGCCLTGWQPRGKQSLKPASIMHLGIWHLRVVLWVFHRVPIFQGCQINLILFRYSPCIYSFSVFLLSGFGDFTVLHLFFTTGFWFNHVWEAEPPNIYL